MIFGSSQLISLLLIFPLFENISRSRKTHLGGISESYRGHYYGLQKSWAFSLLVPRIHPSQNGVQTWTVPMRKVTGEKDNIEVQDLFYFWIHNFLFHQKHCKLPSPPQPGDIIVYIKFWDGGISFAYSIPLCISQCGVGNITAT